MQTATITRSVEGVVRRAYINQLLDYYPYGETRIENHHDTHNQTNRYTGHGFDSQTNLNYMGARYYAGDRGQFISQDPVFQALGDWKTVQEKTGDKLGYYLQNPQTHNSYSYAFNNPLKYVDNNGEFAIQLSFNSGGGFGAAVGSNHTVGFALDGSYGYTVTPYAGGLAGGKLSAGLQLGVSTVDTWADTAGTELYTEFGASAFIVGVDGGFSVSDDKSVGIQIGASAGPETPVYAGAGVGKSTVIVDRNVFDDIVSITKSIRNILSARNINTTKELSTNNNKNDENNN